ncbi:MAG TPA: NADH-quinone oxidoreductase subunit C [Streptosporangiaceae bacterium]|nr:NADH-quinone oxidoreductase subunit C [Streptosporangiaceae bacterium]
MTAPAPVIAAASLASTLAARVATGLRFAGLFGTVVPSGVLISAHLAGGGDVETIDALLPSGAESYPAVSPVIGAAFWYERELHDLFGVVPAGHPRLEPLVLLPARQIRQDNQTEQNNQTGQDNRTREHPDEHLLPRHLTGKGVFTIPHGPVRSGVVESIEYLVETPGEDIPHLNMRIIYKHRGIEKRFEGLAAADGTLLAERVEGIASVAHALAYCHAVERIAGCAVPWRARLVRVLHAELERIANHLDVATRLADAAGLAVATARFGRHKERVLRLVSRLCGSRYGRGVVVAGGVSGLPLAGPAEIFAEIGPLERDVAADAAALMSTASFLDRLRRTGPLRPERAREHGAVGPIGKASGYVDDVRVTRPYDGYPALGILAGEPLSDGDALARLHVRVQEAGQSFHLIRQAADELADAGGGAVAAPCEPASGRAVGWAEAPQGEVLYDVRVNDGRITRCRPRSASFHNLVLMHEVFAGDILTDFPFIEASFGLSVAGAAL